MKTIYADELFALNLAINYLILLATGKLCALPLKRLRFGLSAALGAVYSVICLLPSLDFLSQPIAKLCLGIAMALIAFGGTRRFWRVLLAFFAVSAAFGGAVYAASLLAGSGTEYGTYVNLSFRVLLLSFAACYFVLTVIFRRMARRQKRKTVEVCVIHAGRSARFTALCDTGNELFDPVSGLPVMVADVHSLLPLLPENAPSALKCGILDFVEQMGCAGLSFRLVPYSTLSADSSLLPVFRPESVIVDGKETRDILVGVTARSMCSDGEYSAVINYVNHLEV
jgi:stage II sporulation protein GA (sporulation sigma-E factor processing peptidase)